MKRNLLTLSAFVLGLSMMYSSCKKDDTETKVTPTPVAPSLYDRVGGTELVADPANSGQMIEKGRLTLRAVVDSSILVIAADTQMAKYFPVLFAELGAGNTSGLSALSENFTDFMCRIAVKVDAADFDKFVGNIGAGLAQNGVTSANNKELVDDLVALLYTTKADIVQR